MTSSKPLLLSPSTSLLNLQSNHHQQSNQQQQQQPPPSQTIIVRRRKPISTRSTSSSISSNLSTSDQFSSSFTSTTSNTTHLSTTQPPPPPPSHSSADHHQSQSQSSPSSTITSLFPRSIHYNTNQNQNQNHTLDSLHHHLILPKTSHRHSTYLNHILSLFNSLTQSPITTINSPINLHRNTISPHFHSSSNQYNKRNSTTSTQFNSSSSTSSTTNPSNLPSINLEADGWTYLGTRQDVRLYTRELTSTEQFIISEHQEEFIANSSNQSNSLPSFRGEGFIEGKWNSSDLAATLNSIPARSICDSRLETSKSSLFQILDPDQTGDQLIKLSFKHQYPIGSKHQSLVQAFRPYRSHSQLNPSSHSPSPRSSDDSGGVWVSTSVVDSIIPEPEPTSRSWLALCGFSFRPVSRPPTYSSIPSNQQSQAPLPSTSPESNTSQSRILRPDRTSPIQALSYHPSQTDPSKSYQRITSPPQSSGDLPSIVKRLSLTISPVHNQLTTSLPSQPLSRSAPSNHQTPIINRRLSKNLSQIEWPTPPSQTYTLGNPILPPKSYTSPSIQSPTTKRNSVNFTSPDQSISPSSSLILRRRRASSILSTSSPAHYASSSPTQRLRSGSASTKDEEEELGGGKAVQGTHVSVVMKVYHGPKVPLSLVHQVLCADVPNLIMNLNRYLNRYGFVPHLCRRNGSKGIKVLSEEFNPLNSSYKLQFKSQESHEVLIRFHGLSFTSSAASLSSKSSSSYEILVLRSEKWKLEFDDDEEEEEDKENSDEEKSRKDLWIGAGTIRVSCALGVPVEVLIRKIGLENAKDSDRMSKVKKSDRVVLGCAGFAGRDGNANANGVIKEEV